MTEERKVYGVFIKSVLEKKVYLSINEIGGNIKETLQKKLNEMTYNKCIVEGFIQPGSISILSYSCGLVQNDGIEFCTIFECKITNPVEGQLIECKCKTITKAGIHAHVIQNDVIPVQVFLAREHHNINQQFNNIKEEQDLLVNVIGTRFELNDPYICVIAKLVDRNNEKYKTKVIKKDE